MFDRSLYKEFSNEEALEWGQDNFGNWLVNIQNPNNKPTTQEEWFFRSYTQGIHYVYNRNLRYLLINDFPEIGEFIDKNSVSKAIEEIYRHPIKRDIVVYRYVSRAILRDMKKWGKSKGNKRGVYLMDKGFMSTTLLLDAVRGRDYANLIKNELLKIYVPKGTTCVYVDLISDMQEQEILFPPCTRMRVISRLVGMGRECVIES